MITTDDVDAAGFFVRRVDRRLPVGRLYDVKYQLAGQPKPSWQKRTRAPVRLIERTLGVGDAWSVVNAADRAWAGGDGEWVSLFGDSN